MADPAIKACPADQWTKVATNVTTGIIHITETAPNVYLQTYRDTGEAAPTDKDDAVPFDTPLLISSSAGIDVYIQPVSKAGEVRVDL